jgi:tetratricopeptide (TPR) repeat protein
MSTTEARSEARHAQSLVAHAGRALLPSVQALRLVVVLVVTLAAATAARADNSADAKQHYQRGVTAYNLQRFDVALKEFQAAYENRPEPVFLFDIAQTQRQLGDYDAATRSYRAYLQEQPDAANRDEVLTRIAELQKAAQNRHAQAPPPGVISPTPKAPAPFAAAPVEMGVRKETAAPPKSHSLRNAGIGLVVGSTAVLALGGGFAGLARGAGDAAYHGSTYDYGADSRYHGYQSAEIASFVIGGAALATGAVLITIGTRGAHR